MLNDFSGADKVYIACGYTDLRRGIDGLASIVQQQFHLDPFTNTLFLFCGPRRDRIKALYWEGFGNPRNYLVNPYQMVATDGKYYLIDNYDKYDNISHYRIDRIRHIQPVNHPAKSPKHVKGLVHGLNLPKHMAEHIYMFSGDSAYITMKATIDMIGELIDWFGNVVSFGGETENSIIAHVTANLQAMRFWALQYTPYVTILEPQTLADCVREDLETAIKHYDEVLSDYKKEASSMNDICHVSCSALEGIETLDELFLQWESHFSFEYFVKDGIFNPALFSSPRILYVLRDAHIDKEKASLPYDLRDIVKYPKGEGRTWNNIARWTQALLDNANYSDVETINPDSLSTQLSRVAAMNLKKEAGGARAKEIRRYAAEHREWIKRQIAIIDPDIIIACGTFEELVKCTMEGDTRNCKQIAGTTHWRYDIRIHSKNVPIISSYHPQYNKKNRELVDAMKEIRNDVLENL